MRGKGPAVCHPQPRTCFGRNTLKKCKNNGEADNVVLIDVDSDTLNNVIIVDVPESLKQKLRASSVICIDDDDDETPDNNHPVRGVQSGGDFYDDASSSRRFHPPFNHSRNSVDAVGDECQENLSPVKLSKCKRTYSGKSSSRNRYGLGPESDCSSSDDNGPDCVFMEDSYGKLREHWEKANMKKKHDVRNGKSARCGQASTSGSHPATQKKVVVENLSDQHTEAQVSPSSSNVRYDEENPSPFVQTSDGKSGSAFNSFNKTPFADFGPKPTQETQYSNNEANNLDRGEPFPVAPPFHSSEGQTNKHFEEDQCSRGPSVSSNHEKGNRQSNRTEKFSQCKERTSPAEPCISNPEPNVDVHINFGRTKASCDSRVPNESEGACSSSVDKGKSVSGEHSSWNMKQSVEIQVNDGVVDNDLGAVTEGAFCKGPSLGKSGIEKETGFCQDTVKQVLKELSSGSNPPDEVRTESAIGLSEQSGEMSKRQQQEDEDGPLHSQDGDVTNAGGNLINEREKLKETDEYKRAVEEEWASRQRELRLQAEEAQNLRRQLKRKNAESMRLLDMERRQKQRVEEMREFQKKDEENMNMKEQLRAEVRKELNKLEITSRDMASILRGLGIQVGGGFKPLPDEVRVAYKRALLSFHPDRASGSDIRQLVEAEEKFKLISRMKEKFLKTS